MLRDSACNEVTQDNKNYGNGETQNEWDITFSLEWKATAWYLEEMY